MPHHHTTQHPRPTPSFIPGTIGDPKVMARLQANEQQAIQQVPAEPETPMWRLELQYGVLLIAILGCLGAIVWWLGMRWANAPSARLRHNPDRFPNTSPNPSSLNEGSPRLVETQEGWRLLTGAEEEHAKAVIRKAEAEEEEKRQQAIAAVEAKAAEEEKKRQAELDEAKRIAALQKNAAQIWAKENAEKLKGFYGARLREKKIRDQVLAGLANDVPTEFLQELERLI